MSLPFNQIKKYLELDDTMPLGKYQGLRVARVIEDDPRYIFWIINNTHDLLYFSEAVQDRLYLNARESESEKALDDLMNEFHDDIPF